jgi:hypothetical protein
LGRYGQEVVMEPCFRRATEAAALLTECARMLGFDAQALVRHMTGQKSGAIRAALRACHVTLDLGSARARNPLLSALAVAEAQSVFLASRTLGNSVPSDLPVKVTHGQEH